MLVLTAIALLVSLQPSPSRPDLASLEATFEHIVSAAHAQVGVALIHLESGAVLSINGDERFAMASVYKLPIALELLAQVNEGRLTLDRQVALGPADIRPCCSISRRYPNGGITLTAGELLELAIVESDNTAADAMLNLVGGPAAVERRLRALGFSAINVNRYDGDLNLERSARLANRAQRRALSAIYATCAVPGGDGGFNQRQAGRDTRDNFAHLGLAFNL